MTRKLALQEAIKIIETSRIGKQRKKDIIRGLQLCVDELPFAKWSETAIFDACDQFVADHGHIRLCDFSRSGLPSHPTIKNRFKMTAKEFRDTYYPLPDTPEFKPKYDPRDCDEWNAQFIEEFHRIRCISEQHYNIRRSAGMPVWQTLCKLNGVDTWRQLLYKLGLDTYGKERPKLDVRILPFESGEQVQEDKRVSRQLQTVR